MKLDMSKKYKINGAALMLLLSMADKDLRTRIEEGITEAEA